MKEKLLVSACLLGINCKYSGGNNRLPEAEALAERVGERVINRAGEDVTAAFRLGAERTAEIARSSGVRRALLQERSPSCGCGTVYDGTFSGTLTAGRGVTAALLEKNGVEVYESTRISALLEAEGGQ